MVPTFHQWLRESSDRSPIYTPDQQIVPMIAASPNGLTRRELLQRFYNLDSKVVRDLLNAYVGIGQLTATQEGDTVRYRARSNAVMAI